MYCRQLYEQELDEKTIWGRSGKRIVRKYRCTSGQKKGRIVSKIGSCYGAPNIKKRISLKKTKAKFGKRMIRKALRTKRMNPLSKRVARMNKSSRRKR